MGKFDNVASEHDLKLQMAKEYFKNFGTSIDDRRIDFLVSTTHDTLFEQCFLWAESKKSGVPVADMFAQLFFTIKPIKDSRLPPYFLGVFDKEKFCFIEYMHVQELFNLSDLDWTETPSTLSQKTKNTIANYLKNKEIISFNFDKDDIELRRFIKKNFVLNNSKTNKIQITKNNFIFIYNKWIKEVFSYIRLDKEQDKNIDQQDLFLADLISKDNQTINDNLNIVIHPGFYEVKQGATGWYSKILFTPEYKKAHTSFWAKYERPPKKEYIPYILNRRDLLVPQDIRERKGAYFTPKIWVEKSQEYLAKTFGENWQENYYVWDCCAGTCNLLAGLTEKHRIWASTLDQADVDIVHDIIHNGKLNLLKDHVFQFDFLNDDFSKLPQSLRDVLEDEEKRKKLIIYINPPYAAEGTKTTITGTGKNKKNLTTYTKIYSLYGNEIGRAKTELFALFFIRIKKEILGSVLAQFSTLKIAQAPNFSDFRRVFNSHLERAFVVPANTFDNVTGKFPIGFFIWNTNKPFQNQEIQADVFDAKGNSLGIKNIRCEEKNLIGHWLAQYKNNMTLPVIGMLNSGRNDFQNQGLCYIKNSINDKAHSLSLSLSNIAPASIFFAVRHCMPATWLNDRDQFLTPIKEEIGNGFFDSQKSFFYLYEKDEEFKNNCLVFTLFHQQNKIKSANGINYWIPFTEKEVDAKDNFKSNFMAEYLKGRTFSTQAQAVLEAGKELWKYYHATIKNDINNPDINASLDDIRTYFKKVNAKGKRNNTSTDQKFNFLDTALKEAIKVLAVKIAPKVYEYGFLKD